MNYTGKCNRSIIIQFIFKITLEYATVNLETTIRAWLSDFSITLPAQQACILAEDFYSASYRCFTMSITVPWNNSPEPMIN